MCQLSLFVFRLFKLNEVLFQATDFRYYGRIIIVTLKFINILHYNLLQYYTHHRSHMKFYFLVLGIVNGY